MLGPWNIPVDKLGLWHLYSYGKADKQLNELWKKKHVGQSWGHLGCVVGRWEVGYNKYRGQAVLVAKAHLRRT